MASVYERITNALSSLGKRRERDNGTQDGGRNTAGGTSREAKRFRPWEQSDLHRRLETYKPLTWFAKPESVGPVPCALKGWINDSCDTLTCEHCGAKLKYPAQVPYDQRQAAADLFAPSLTAKHGSSCPWRQTQCDHSLLAYNPANNTNDELCNLFQALQNKLLRVDVLPDLDAIAIQAVRDKATPYGSYDTVVMGGGGGPHGENSGALVPVPRRRKMPKVRISEVGLGGSDSGSEDPDATQRTPSGTLISDPSATETYIVQPSKLTPQQKARLLALLGWDVEVLQPDSASGSAAAPYTQSTGYSLQHLGIKPKKPGSTGPSSVAAASGSGGCVDDTGRYPMSSVVLKCPRCNGRMGLWNFAGVRPVPTGRLTPGQPAAGAAALLSPKVGDGAGTTAAGAVPDPLSYTIAGGQYGLHGLTGAGAKPFGAASSAPFRFGSTSSTAPVFGVSALDAAALNGAGGGFGFGFGASAGAGSTPKLLTAGPAVAAAPSGGAPGAATPVARPPAATPEPPAGRGGPAGGLTGHKRKASEPGIAEPMAVDSSAGSMTPGVPAAGQEGKRQRLASTPSVSSGAAAETQPRELDPVNQHRSWCPWVYTGTAEQPHMSGWQHMLQALTTQQQQTAPAPPPAADATAGMAPPPSVMSPTSADPKQLRDKALAAIRSL